MTPSWEYFPDLEELIWLGYKRVGDPTWWRIQEAMGERLWWKLKEADGRRDQPPTGHPVEGTPPQLGPGWMSSDTGMTHAGQFLSLGGGLQVQLGPRLTSREVSPVTSGLVHSGSRGRPAADVPGQKLTQHKRHGPANPARKYQPPGFQTVSWGSKWLNGLPEAT